MKRNRIADGINHVDLLGIRFSGADRRSLYRLAKSKNARDRRLCLDYLECRQGVYHNRRFIFDIADVLIPDISERVRWGTLTLLGDYAESNPAQLWPVVVKWNTPRSRDIRAGIACCILEHILSHHSSPYFQRAKRVIEDGNRRFGLTLAYCYKTGQSVKSKNAKRFDLFVATLQDAKREKRKYDSH